MSLIHGKGPVKSIKIENEISVVIASYYRHDCLSEVFDLFKKQTHVPDEIIVVDQTPLNDRPKNFYDDLDLNIQVINLDKPSRNLARNLGVSKAKYSIILMIDDDILFGDDFIEKHLQVMNDECVDVVNGATTLQDKLPEDWPWPTEDMDPVRFFLAAPNHQWEGMMMSVSSCNFSIRKEVFNKSGGFDEFCPRMDDFELGYRLYKSGAKIFFSTLPRCKHLRAGGGLRKNPLRYDRLAGAIYLHRKHFPGWITTQFILKHILRLKVIYRPWLLIKLFMAYRHTTKLIKSCKL